MYAIYVALRYRHYSCLHNDIVYIYDIFIYKWEFNLCLYEVVF